MVSRFILAAVMVSSFVLAYTVDPAHSINSGTVTRVESPLFVAYVDPETKLAEHIHFVVRAADVAVVGDKPRAFNTPPELRDVCLEDADYNGSGYDRGHLRALSLSAGSEYWNDVNCMADIVPMAPSLNRETFREPETTIAEWAADGDVYVSIIAEYDGKKRPPMPNADEPHAIPTSFTVRVMSPPRSAVWHLDNPCPSSN